MVLSEENGPGAHPARGPEYKKTYSLPGSPALWVGSFTFYEYIKLKTRGLTEWTTKRAY